MQKKDQTFNFFLGVDLGKSALFVALRNQAQLIDEAVFNNDAAGLTSLFQWLIKKGASKEQTLICVEHTGVYGERLAMVAHGAGWKLWKVSGSRIFHIQLKQDRLKSDPVDARKIAEFAHRFADQAHIYVPQEPHIQQLKQLSRLRTQFVDHRQRILNQIHSYTQQPVQMPEVLAHLTQAKDQLSESIKDIELQISKLIKSHKTLRRIFEILCSIPGIGPVTANKVIITTQGFTILSCAKKLASFAGTAPFENSSGVNAKYRKKRTSRKADQELKKLLTTAVMSVIAEGRFFEPYYKLLLLKQGRLNLQAINIIRNKLLKLMVTLVNKDQLFDKELFINNCKSWT